MSGAQELAAGLIFAILFLHWSLPDGSGTPSKFARIWAAAWNSPAGGGSVAAPAAALVGGAQPFTNNTNRGSTHGAVQ